MKTVTLWNVPVDIAELAISALRDKVGEMITNREPIKTVKDLMYTIEDMEETVAEVKNNG